MGAGHWEGNNREGWSDSRTGGVALVAVCSHLLKVLIKEPEFLEVCEWLGGADWSGREIVLMYRN